MAQGPGWVPHLLTFQEQGLQRDDPPETTPMYTPDQKAYKCYWHKGTPLYAQTGIHVHLVHHLSVPGRLGVYEVVGDGWQLNVINTHVPFGEATEPFLQALAEAYRQMAMLAPTVIIGDMNAAPTPADRGGQATPQDQAVRDTIEMLGLVDLTASLEGQPSHFPHQTDAAPSRIDVCYGDPTTIIRAEARYGPLPLGPTGHSPLHIRLTIPNLPPSPPEDADQGLPPPLKMPPLHDKHAWSQYHRAIDRARRIQPDPTDLLTAMRTAAVACGFQQHPHTDDDQPPTALGDMLHDLWHAKQQLATLLHTDTPQTRRQIHHCRTHIAQIRADLQRWHIHRQQRIAQEHERYAQHELPYKAIRHLNDAMTDTGHRTITTVRQEDGSLTNDPATVLQATQDSFLRQHTPTQDTLDPDTQAKIDRLPRVFNHAQRRHLEKRPFTIHEVRKAIHSLRQHKTPGYDGLPAEAYYHLPAHLLRVLAHRLWDIVTGRTPLPPDWANVVRPLYKKGDWANPDNWRPIVCAVTEVKIVWTILLRRIRPHLDPHIPASLWGAIPGRSPHEAIFLQDTIADMDPVDLIIASLDVKGAFPNTPWLLLEAVWKRLGLPFYNFTSDYIRTRKYTVRTGAGLTPFLEPGSGVPQGGAEGPFLYVLVTLPLALAIEQDYPAYAPYPLLSPLVGFADDTNLTVAHTPHDPHAPDPGPTVTQQANDLLDVTVSYLSHNNLIVHPTKSVAMIKGSATPPTLGPQGPPMQVVTTTTHLGVVQAANPEDATLPPKLQSHLAHLPRYASPPTKALSLSHQSLAYYLTGVLNASIGFQALHLTHPTTALQPATRAVTKAWAAHGGWPTSIPTRAIRAAWPHYGDAIGDEVKAAYTRHTALLLHRMTHNHSPEVREVTAIRLQAAQRARNTCPRWVLHQTGMPTNMNTRLWNHLQLLLPSPHHAILTNHTCPEKGPLAVLCGDLHHHPKGTIHTIDLVGASITVVYVTLAQMRVLHHSGAHHTPFLQLPEWPQYRLFHHYLTQTARTAGHTLAGSKDMRIAYREFTRQHPRPIPETPPYAPTGSKHEPVPPVTGPVPPLTLLLAPNEAKPTQTTVIHHGAKWRIPKHHMTARDLPKVPQDSQSMPRTCWACDPEAPTAPWPVLHLIARHHTHPTTHLPPQAYAWIAPWFHRTDTNPTVAWNPDHAPKWLFTTTPTCPRPDPAGVAIRYSMYEPGRTGKHEHPYYPLHHSCHTPEHRTQTLTCHDLNPDTAYILHYIYSYLTQGQPEQGLIALSPQAKHIISKGIGVYATPILQPTTPVAHLATGLAIYAYLPMNPCRLPQPSPADRLFFTDASGESALTPITGGATLQLTNTGEHYHMDHHTGHTTYGASSHGELGAMADAITEVAAHLPAYSPHIVRVWFVVDATVDTHLLLRIARQPLHKATATSLGTQALLLWKALRSLPPYVQLHIVKQESHRHQYGNGKVDNQAVHQRTTHLPALQIPDVGRNHTHLQHVPPVPEPHQTPDWVPEDAPYSSHDRAYHYPNPVQHLARVLGDADSRAHIQELQDRLQVPLYHSALRPANVPAHLQKRRIQLLREQLPFLTRVARWLARKHIHVPDEHTRCPCDHTTPEDWEHFKKCPLHTDRDTLVGWSPAETLRQHEGWPAHSHAHQATEHLFRDPLIKEATMRGAVTQALHRHLTKHTESPMEAAAHLQLEAVRRAAAQMVHRKHLLLTHAEQLTDPTAREHMQRLIHYHAVHDPDVH